jgi:kinesin family member 22
MYSNDFFLKPRLTVDSERDKLDGDIVHKLSPKSRKKTGRAYVALARAHSEKCGLYCCQCIVANIACRGDLQVALDLYRKAESYVPDNMKLKERWIFFVIRVFLYRLTCPYPSL